MQRLTSDFLRRSPGRTARALWCAALIGAVAGAIPARAQWMETFGAPGSNEVGSAVAMVSDGGYIAAGSADDTGSGITNAYVVRRDAAGGVLWDMTYHIGAPVSSGFTDVKVCTNGDYILAGWVGSAQPTVSHLLAMRISPNGVILWSRIIGDNATLYRAASLLEAGFGNGTTTQAGDIVVGGSTRNYVAGTDNGFIARLTADGEPIWYRLYDPGPDYSHARIFSLTETRIAPAAGDIVASGDAYSTRTGIDAMVLRVDGGSGDFLGSPRGAAMFDAGGYEFGFSVIERTLGASQGDLVVAGASTAVPWLGTYAEMMMELYPDPCDPAGPQGGNLTGLIWGSTCVAMSVREITDPALGVPGDVVAGGYMFQWQTGQQKGFMQQFSAVTMGIASPIHSYGGSGSEYGFGVAECPGALGAPGFILVGSTNSQSPLFNNTDLWLSRTDNMMRNCGEAEPQQGQQNPTIDHHCISITPTEPPLAIICGVQSLITDWGNDPCVRDLKQNPLPARLGIMSGNEPGPTISSPNPVRRGDPVTIQCSSAGEGHGEIVISDMAGREVYRCAIDAKPGTARVVIPTSGLAPGAYLYSVGVNGTLRTGSLTVTGR